MITVVAEAASTGNTFSSWATPIGVVIGAMIGALVTWRSSKKSVYDRLEALIGIRKDWPTSLPGVDTVDDAIALTLAEIRRREPRPLTSADVKALEKLWDKAVMERLWDENATIVLVAEWMRRLAFVSAGVAIAIMFRVSSTPSEPERSTVIGLAVFMLVASGLLALSLLVVRPGVRRWLLRRKR
ncbi:hypothetical protein H7K45_27840 [Mycobacterium yunnanensis]|uniref:Uncharacterized protein n=1 Tax=Mycobacterium yunnanensis TaxID=368477 RepID=A0A9X2YRY9_9MYCO|nr:hypothetical protein [Mycobacterium yunnanensis]MCV7424363.1 hypothetical protein [Mycobacterium yunnanensis]